MTNVALYSTSFHTWWAPKDPPKDFPLSSLYLSHSYFNNHDSISFGPKISPVLCGPLSLPFHHHRHHQLPHLQHPIKEAKEAAPSPPLPFLSSPLSLSLCKSWRKRVNHCQSLVNGMSMTQHQLKDLQSSSTRLGMRKRQVASLIHHQRIIRHSSLVLLLLLENLSLKNGFVAYKLPKQNDEVALTLEELLW